MKKMQQIVTDTASARRNEYHTYSSPASLPRIHAEGISTTNCLVMETIIDAKPMPVAWNEDIIEIENAAITKWYEIILMAGTPIAIISSDAENMESSAPGNSWKTNVPSAMIDTAIVAPNFKVLIILSLFFAP